MQDLIKQVKLFLFSSTSQANIVYVQDLEKHQQEFSYNYLLAQRKKQKEYLHNRDKDLMNNNTFYVSAANTDVRKTMRNYVSEELPEQKDVYKFLFVTDWGEMWNLW